MDWLGFGLFLLAVLLMLLSHERMLRRTSLCLCCVAGALFAAWCVSRFVGVEYLYPLSNPITSLLYGNPKALYTLLCAVTGLLCAVQVVAEFIRTAFSRQRQMIALQSRSQQAQEQYKQAQESLRNVSAFRHEWKNHISVLSLLQRKGDTEGLTEYLAQLDDQLEQLSPLHYTANFIVNTVLQRYVAKAKEDWRCPSMQRLRYLPSCLLMRMTCAAFSSTCWTMPRRAQPEHHRASRGKFVVPCKFAKATLPSAARTHSAVWLPSTRRTIC